MWPPSPLCVCWGGGVTTSLPGSPGGPEPAALTPLVHRPRACLPPAPDMPASSLLGHAFLNQWLQVLCHTHASPTRVGHAEPKVLGTALPWLAGRGNWSRPPGRLPLEGLCSGQPRGLSKAVQLCSWLGDGLGLLVQQALSKDHGETLLLVHGPGPRAPAEPRSVLGCSSSGPPGPVGSETLGLDGPTGSWCSRTWEPLGCTAGILQGQPTPS